MSCSISAMASSLKSNKRSRPRAFERLKNLGKGSYNKVYFDKKATPKQLKDIREKAICESKIMLLKKIAYLAIFFLIAVYVIGFVKF